MSDLFPLEVFPEGGLSSSVTTTVLIGVWVVAFFNLRFGWTLSALVVPGYLVPLLIVKPITACVIVLESVLTYRAAHWLSEWVRFRGRWISFFGRDRFFLIVLTSVCVRLLFDAALLPAAGAWLPAWRIDLHSFGLVAVPLIANYLWKPGMIRGLLHLQVILTVTYAITRYALIPYTNFRMAGLFYMYEDAAGSMLSSPKSYILLVSTAYLASRVNLKYGWEYSGILIPALLALEWITPLKIAASIVEAAVILVGARALLASPLLRGMTVEGARKIVLFFTIGYAWRMVLGYYLHAWRPDWQVSDVYGFGYLLSTLLAIKAYEREAAIRIAGATLRLCGAGGVLGCAIGFGLTFAPGPPRLLSEAAAPPDLFPIRPQFHTDLSNQLRIDKLRLYAATMPGHFEPESEADLDAFDRGLRALLQATPAARSESFDRGVRWMSAAGMEVGIVGGRYCYIRETEPVRGRGLYVLDLEATSHLVVAVPHPLGAPDSLDLGLSLFHQHGARALLVGFDRPSQIVSRSLPRSAMSRNCFVHAAHLVSGGNLLIVDGADPTLPGMDRLSVQRTLPDGLNVGLLKRELPNLWVGWGLPAASAPWLNEFWNGVAVLNVTPSSRLSAAAAAVADGRSNGGALRRYDVSLSAWMLEQKDRIAVEGSGAYRPALLEEMLYLDNEVVTPLVQIAGETASLRTLTAGNTDRLRLASLAAATMDLELATLADDSTGGEYLVLRDAPAGEGRRWGTFVFRLGSRFPAIFEVSRPLAELRTLEFGTTAFQATDGFALLMTGAHLRANMDGSADLLQFTNKVSLLHLVRQVLLRRPPATEMLFVQVRGARFSFPVQAVLSPGIMVAAHDELPPLTRQLRESLREQLGVEAILNSSRPEASGYTVSGLYANTMRSQPETREVVGLWLSEELRQEYRPVAQSTLMEDQFHALRIPTLDEKLNDRVLREAPSEPPVPAAKGPDELTTTRLKAVLSDYVQRQDVLLLRKLQRDYADWDWLRLDDPQTGQPYLLMTAPGGGYQLIVNLAPGLGMAEPKRYDRPTTGNLQEFVRRRERWIEYGRTQ